MRPVYRTLPSFGVSRSRVRTTYIYMTSLACGRKKSQPDTPTYLVWVGQQGGNKLGTSSGDGIAKRAKKVIQERPGSPGSHDGGLTHAKPLLALFIHDPLHRAFRDTEERGAQPLVQSVDAFVTKRLAQTVQRVPVFPADVSFPGMVLVELKTGLDHPDGIGGHARDDAGGDGGAEMDPGRLLAVIGVPRYRLLAVTVHEEVDGARRHDGNEIGPQALEERAPTFDFGYGEEDLEGFAHVEGGGSGEGERGRVGDAAGLTGCVEVGLVEVGLQSCSQDI
jgi:hypothetical protein